MGTPNPNLFSFAAVLGGCVSVAAHVSLQGPALTGYRLALWTPGAFEESPDATEAQRDAVVSAAAQGFGVFSAACVTAWGEWWTARTVTEKQNWHVAHAGTAFRLRRHHVTALDASDPVDAPTRAYIEAAAQQSFTAFDAACVTALGTWWSAWPLGDRAAWHVAVKGL